MRLIISLFVLTMISSCSAAKLSFLQYLEGTWKIEGRETYEEWTLEHRKELQGFVYAVSGTNKHIKETLTLKWVDGNLVYEATVPDQNQGNTIQFKLNTEETSCFSFENMNHDFPKKIQYKKIDDQRVEVSVKGSDGTGFSYIQVKQ